MVETHSVAGLIRTVDNTVQRTGFMAKEALPETILKITVTASGTEGMNRDEHARAGYVAVGNGVAEADVEVLPSLKNS